jgi:hypothetical protein
MSLLFHLKNLIYYAYLFISKLLYFLCHHLPDKLSNMFKLLDSVCQYKVKCELLTNIIVTLSMIHPT